MFFLTKKGARSAMRFWCTYNPACIKRHQVVRATRRKLDGTVEKGWTFILRKGRRFLA
jgi:hypothetical protein